MSLLLIALRVLIVSLHLVAGALACGGPLGAAILPLEDSTRRRLAGFGLWALAAVAMSGLLAVVLVLLGCCPGYGTAAARLPTRAYGMLATELVFTGFLYWVYQASWQRLSNRRLLHGAIALMAATNLLYHFPTFMIVLGHLADEPTLSAESVIQRKELLRLLRAPQPLAQTAHFWFLSIVLTATATLAISERKRDGVVAGVLGVLGIVGMFLSGIALVMSLPAEGVRSVLGFSSVAGWLFYGGVACAVLLLATFANAVTGGQGRARRAVGLALGAVLLMVSSALLR